MKLFNWQNILLSSFFIVIAIIYNFPLWAITETKPFTLITKNPVSETLNISFANITLSAWQQTTLPNGVPPQLNQDIGFASVFLSLHNQTEKSQRIIIKSIKIHNVYNGQLQSFSFKAKQINLKPLENSEIAFHLSNKTGYSGQGKVKAIITYQIGNKVNIIESESVEVDKH
ncbi:hypothetical protein WKK05_25935 [Nostoc sp. UHCC 0302]|uniref:hypothetical protein n=1 Tax=Nostoc sp. UHCC 0302 TaxID=3134896 RepID=UPI00311CDF58